MKLTQLASAAGAVTRSSSASRPQELRTQGGTEPLTAGDHIAIEKPKGGAIAFSFEYLRHLKERDPETGAHFDAYFRPRLKIKLNQHRLQASDKQDIIQETLVRVLQAVQCDKVRLPEAFGAYVHGICRNVLCAFWKPAADDIDELEIPDPTESPESLLLHNERRKQVKLILESLSARDRNLLRAKIFDQLTSQQMVVTFGASTPAHLYLMVHRAGRKFAKACRKNGLDFS